jgi:hypothetical protein
MSRKSNTLIGLAGGLAAAVAAAAAAYWFILRPRHLRWGATDEEARLPLPGDELVPQAKINATHAITIHAPAERVWPWIVQLGQGRGGFYSYTWIEKMIGADIDNSDRILPEHQQIKVGDIIPLAQGGFGFPVAILEVGKMLVMHGDTRVPGEVVVPMKPGEFLASSWGFYLFPRPDGSTRLVERWRADYPATIQNQAAYKAFMEPGAFIMERKMLLGIKQRAEVLIG